MITNILAYFTIIAFSIIGYAMMNFSLNIDNKGFFIAGFGIFTFSIGIMLLKVYTEAFSMPIVNYTVPVSLGIGLVIASIISLVFLK